MLTRLHKRVLLPKCIAHIRSNHQLYGATRRISSLSNVEFLCSEIIKPREELELGICTKRMGHLSQGSALASAGGSIVHAAVNSAKAEGEPGEDFLPMTVDYRARASAFGKLPIGRAKKELNNSEGDILVSRFIDRALRPLFPKGYVDEIQVLVTNHSADGLHDPTVLAVNAASFAMLNTDQPWNGPIGCVRVGYVDGQLKVNPTVPEMESSPLDLLYAGTMNRAVMVEAGGVEVPEDLMKQALQLAHESAQGIVKSQIDFISARNNNKTKKSVFNINEDLYNFINARFYNEALSVFQGTAINGEDLQSKDVRGDLEGKFRSKVMEEVNNDGRWKDLPKIIKGMAVDKLIHKAFRAAILQPETASDELIKRSDGRFLNEIRELECVIDPLPNTHGSSYFKRGDTHVISSVTLASANDAKESYPTNGSGNIRKDYFFLHYDFPPYSTGEVSALQTTNRRMVGHGALAEKALKYVMPKFENFPYTVRVVSECVSSNGSSSMASACAGTLSLKAAGVPIANDVAGISVGLITDDAFSEANANDDELLKQKTSYRLLTDILGSEDHHGDMDFKIAGSKEGITAIQLDVKLPGGVPLPILFEAIDKSKTARMEILKKLEGATTLTSRSTVPKKLPKAALITVDPDRMGHIIGVHGGIIDTIKKFYDITVEQLKDTTDMIYIYGEEGKYVDEAEELIADIGVMVRPDTMFEKAVVLDVRDYGLLVKLNRSSTGLLHIGELSHDRELINKPLNTLLKKGHVLPVKVLTVDKFTGLVTLTRKGLYETPTEANYSDVDLLNISASEPTIIEEKSGPDIKPPKAFDKNFFKTSVFDKTTAGKSVISSEESKERLKKNIPAPRQNQSADKNIQKEEISDHLVDGQAKTQPVKTEKAEDPISSLIAEEEQKSMRKNARKPRYSVERLIDLLNSDYEATHAKEPTNEIVPETLPSVNTTHLLSELRESITIHGEKQEDIPASVQPPVELREDTNQSNLIEKEKEPDSKPHIDTKDHQTSADEKIPIDIGFQEPKVENIFTPTNISTAATSEVVSSNHPGVPGDETPEELITTIKADHKEPTSLDDKTDKEKKPLPRQDKESSKKNTGSEKHNVQKKEKSEKEKAKESKVKGSRSKVETLRKRKSETSSIQDLIGKLKGVVTETLPSPDAEKANNTNKEAIREIVNGLKSDIEKSDKSDKPDKFEKSEKPTPRKSLSLVDLISKLRTGKSGESVPTESPVQITPPPNVDSVKNEYEKKNLDEKTKNWLDTFVI